MVEPHIEKTRVQDKGIWSPETRNSPMLSALRLLCLGNHHCSLSHFYIYVFVVEACISLLINILRFRYEQNENGKGAA